MVASLMLGALNGHAAGIILKEAVRRAILVIRNERQVFEVAGKVGYSGDLNDVCTSADHKAQAVYLRTLREFCNTVRHGHSG